MAAPMGCTAGSCFAHPAPRQARRRYTAGLVLPPHNSLFTALLVALLLAFAAAAPQAPQPAKPKAPQPANELSAEELEKEFALAAEQFLALLESGDPERFPEACSEDGVVFGLAPPAIPRKEIREEIEKRTGVYCVLFDTGCLRTEAASHRVPKAELPALQSLRERLRTATAREARIEVTAIDEFWLGDLRLELEFPPGMRRRREAIEFSFERKDGAWRLIAVSVE